MANVAVADIAKEFNLEPPTVNREIEWAKQQGLIQNYADQILTSLVPEAIKTVQKSLTEGNVKAAIEVLKGTGLLSTSKPLAQQPSPSTEGGEPETLEAYIRISNPGGGNSARTQFKPGIRNSLIPPGSEAALNAPSAKSAPQISAGSEASCVIDAEVVAAPLCGGGDESHLPNADQGVGIPADAA